MYGEYKRNELLTKEREYKNTYEAYKLLKRDNDETHKKSCKLNKEEINAIRSKYTNNKKLLIEQSKELKKIREEAKEEVEENPQDETYDIYEEEKSIDNNIKEEEDPKKLNDAVENIKKLMQEPIYKKVMNMTNNIIVKKDDPLLNIEIPENIKHTGIVKEFIDRVTILKNNTKPKTKKRGKYETVTRYQLITLNPSECNIEELKNIMKDIKSKKTYNIYAYTYEQRGRTTEDMGKGKHIHIILNGTKSPSDILRSLKTTLKKYDKFNNEESINITTIKDTNDDLRRTINYMCGIKSAEKIGNVIINIEWRKQNKLKTIYTKKGLYIEEPNIKIEEEQEAKIKEITINDKKYIKIRYNDKDIYAEI